jgi:hypothetical protein
MEVTVAITTWNAIGTDPAVRRMGPMAQDFYAGLQARLAAIEQALGIEQ